MSSLELSPNPGPDAPDPGTRVSDSRPHPRTWLPSSDPNPGPHHGPASRLLGGAQCRSAGQSRRQQVQGESAAREDQEQAEQGAHLGARSRTRGTTEEPGASAGDHGAGGPSQRNAFADGPRRGLRQAPPPDPGPAPGPDSAGCAPGPRCQRKAVFQPSWRVSSFHLAFSTFICFFLHLFAGSLPGAGRSRGESRALPTTSLQSSGQDSLVPTPL